MVSSCAQCSRDGKSRQEHSFVHPTSCVQMFTGTRLSGMDSALQLGDLTYLLMCVGEEEQDGQGTILWVVNIVKVTLYAEPWGHFESPVRKVAYSPRRHNSMWGIIAWIIVGGIAGWLASLVVRGTGLGLIGDIIVGIVGGLIGGFLLSLLLPGSFSVTGFNLGSVIVAFIGAVVLLLLVRLFTGRRTTARV